MADDTAHIGVLSVELYLPMSGSLKTKRRVVKSLKDRIRGAFNVSVAEIAQTDKWQRSVVGICAIGNDRRYLDGSLQRILSLIHTVHDLEIIKHEIEFI